MVGGTTGILVGVPISDQFLVVGNQALGSALAFLVLMLFGLSYLVIVQAKRFKGL
jgi:ABC-type spermidine/putrescine transport system permease subunit I